VKYIIVIVRALITVAAILLLLTSHVDASSSWRYDVENILFYATLNEVILSTTNFDYLSKLISTTTSANQDEGIWLALEVIMDCRYMHCITNYQG
jgi:hypothetical protein